MLLNAIKPSMAELGYKKIGPYHDFVKTFSDGINGFISLGYSNCLTPHTTYVDINIGYGEDRSNNLLQDLLGRKRIHNSYACCNINYCDLFPESKYSDYVWKIDDETSVKKVASIIITNVNNHIDPFLSEVCTAKTYIDRVLEGKHLTTSRKDHLIPIVYYLLGEKKKGLAYIEKQLSEGGTHYSDIDDLAFIENYKKLPQ